MIEFLGKLTAFLFAIIAILAIIALYAIITAFPIMLLWNYCLIPAIPGIKTITFLQALGLKVLFTLLIYVSNNSDKRKK